MGHPSKPPGAAWSYETDRLGGGPGVRIFSDGKNKKKVFSRTGKSGTLVGLAYKPQSARPWLLDHELDGFLGATILVRTKGDQRPRRKRYFIYI